MASRSEARLHAQTALVRLGADFEPANAFHELDRPRPGGWRTALGQLRPGMTASEIFQVVGAPFFDGHHGGSPVWEYDVFRDGHYRTFRLDFSGQRLRECHQVENAAHEPYRDNAP